MKNEIEIHDFKVHIRVNNSKKNSTDKSLNLKNVLKKAKANTYKNSQKCSKSANKTLQK